jgi:hypothetical protein
MEFRGRHSVRAFAMRSETILTSKLSFGDGRLALIRPISRGF